MKRLFPLLFLPLVGCAALSPDTIDRQNVQANVARGVIGYCIRSGPAREETREGINASLAPHGHYIQAWCRGDPDNPADATN